MALAGEVLDTTERLRGLSVAWDALAVERGLPFCSPAWMLAWWRHVAAPRAALRAVAVRDGDELVAIAPFYTDRRPGRPTRYRLLGASTSHRVEPLAKPGREQEAAAVIARALAGVEPRADMIRFESVDAGSGWPARIADAWPDGRRPLTLREWAGPAPTATLDGLTFDAWMQGKSRNFRSQAGRMRRRLETRGARFAVASTEQELERGLAAFARLHHARWQDRGGSVALDASVERALAEAGRALLASGRFRLMSIEAEGKTISAHIFVAAGGEVSYWNGGFDEEWAADQPSMRALVAAIEDAFERSDRRLDLGGGEEPYKHRLADGEDLLETALVVPRGRRYLLTKLQLAPHRLRREVARRLSDETRARVRNELSRLPGVGRSRRKGR